MKNHIFPRWILFSKYSRIQEMHRNMFIGYFIRSKSLIFTKQTKNVLNRLILQIA